VSGGGLLDGDLLGGEAFVLGDELAFAAKTAPSARLY
jgi:hypothetical protein